MKKSRFRSGLSFGIGMSVFFLVEKLFTNDNQTSNEIVKSIVSSVFTGIISGILFGWLTGHFSRTKLVNETTKVVLDTGEHIVFQTTANHVQKFESLGSELYLTNKRLIFKSDKINIQNHQLSINWIEISSIDRYRPLGLVKNGLNIITKQNMSEKFVVDQADKWLEQLAKIKN